MKTKLKKFIVVILGLMILIPSVFAADYLPVQVYATDTVAGYPSALRTSLVNPNQDVRFVVEKPDGAVIQVPAQADLEGVAKTDFYGHQTKIAGKYDVAVVYPGSSTSSPLSTFTVYPDQVSETQSTLRSTLQMVEATKDVTFVVVTLYDQYRNPVSNHYVKLVSSRSEDNIEVLQQGVTDGNGRANFKVKSSFPGISVFTAMDVTLNKILSDREEVIFFAPSAPAIGSLYGANLLSADIGGDGDVLPGPVDSFEIEDVASTVKVGEELNVTVVARDKNDNVAKNYTGTILFSVPDDDNAVLPNNGEYTFKASDQGKFTFSLSLQFSKIGKQEIQIFDKSNFKITGEHEVEVVSRQAAIISPTSSDLSIKSPADGSELGSNLVIITGKGNENMNLKIFDNDSKIGDSETDGDGFFSFEAKNLSSGSHTFYAMSDTGKVSKSVTLKIDTIAPVLNSFDLDAEGSVVPGTRIDVEIQSEPGLESAKLRVQGMEQIMTESSSEPGTYEATVGAPAQDGDFAIDVILVDSLFNKSEFLNKGTIIVKSPEANKPSTVKNLTAVPGDTVIDLTWDDVIDHDTDIQKYKIYYGVSMDNLDKTAETLDSTAKWQLRDLTNDTQYFIAITAVDSRDVEGDIKSTIIAATPILPDVCENVDCGDNGACSEGVCVCDEGWSGLTCNVEDEIDDTMLPVDITLPVDTPAIPTPQPTAYDSTVMLTWTPFREVQAYYYKVFIGFTSGQYTDSVITQNNQPTVTIQDLVNNYPYYFAVVALDINGNQISQLSYEVTATPTGTAFRPSAPISTSGYYDANGNFVVGTTSAYNQNAYGQTMTQSQVTQAVKTKTGPESLWVIFISAVFAYFFYHHKRKVLTKLKT